MITGKLVRRAAALTAIAVLTCTALTAGAHAAPPARPAEVFPEAMTSAAAVTSWGPNRLDVFFRGSSHELRHRWFDGAWHPSQSLDGDLDADPAAVSWGPGRIDVFSLGPGGNLIHTWFGRAWHPWERIGGGLHSGVAVASWAPGRLDVFGLTSRNTLLHWWFDGSWHDPEERALPAGFDWTDAPAAVSWGPGRIDLALVGIAARFGVTEHTWYQNGWHGWDLLPGFSAGTPALSSRGAGRLDMITQDHGMNHYWFTAGGWHGPEPLPTDLYMWPGAVSWNSTRIDVFGATKFETLGHAWWNGTWHS